MIGKCRKVARMLTQFSGCMTPNELDYLTEEEAKRILEINRELINDANKPMVAWTRFKKALRAAAQDEIRRIANGEFTVGSKYTVEEYLAVMSVAAGSDNHFVHHGPNDFDLAEFLKVEIPDEIVGEEEQGFTVTTGFDHDRVQKGLDAILKHFDIKVQE